MNISALLTHFQLGQNKGLFSLETGDGGGHIFGALRGEEKQIKKKKKLSSFAAECLVV